MSPSRWIPRHAALLVALAMSACVLVATRSELVIAREPLNDLAFHLPLSERLSEAIRAGEDPLDCWVSEWTLGHPVPRTYQPLGPLVVASIHVALDGRVALPTVFVVAHWLLLGLLPLAIFAGARLLRLPPGACAAAAVLSPLLSTDLLFGLELGSTCWRGSGLFTQSWAQCLLPLALGFGVRRVRGDGRLVPAALLLALTFSAHFVYGLIGALSLVLAAALPAPRPAGGIPAAAPRAVRLLTLGALTFALSAWLLVPLVLDRAWVNHSRWEAAWKWDSLGLPKVATLVATGRLLDFNRFPAVSLLALLGLAVVAGRIVLRKSEDSERLVLAGALLWLVLFCGRGAWDGLYDLIGMADVPLHRLIGGAHLFLVMLAGIGLAFLARLPPWFFSRLTWRHAPPLSAALGLLVAFLAIAPAIADRLQFVKTGESWGRETIALTDLERADIDAAVALCKQRGGRAWSGSAGGWGKDFGVKWTPFHAFLSMKRVPQVSFLFHAMALTSDVMVRFDESNPAHWRLFGVRTGVAPPDREFGDFTQPIAQFGRFHVFAGPGGGMFDLVDVVGALRCDRRSFYDVVDPWLSSEGPAQHRHLALDLEGRFPEPGFPSRPADEPFPQGAEPALGSVLSETREGETYGARVSVEADRAWVMLKMTWHPAWRATLDGAPAPTSHVTPGFVAVRVPRGEHDVSLSYEPGRMKLALLLLAAPALLGAILLERGGRLARAEARLAAPLASRATSLAASPGARELAGVVGLALLAGMPLLLPGLGSGHDAVAYPPRVVELHENVRHGILLPRWAPDLSAGHGQPFFLFTPPLPGWLAEPIFAATGDVSRAIGLSAFALLVLGIFLMRRAAKEIASNGASWTAAASFALAPYVLTDLHVRAAFSESAALMLSPLALLGLLRHARVGGARPLALASAGVALVGLSHHAFSLLLLPVLLSLAAFHGLAARSPRVALRQLAAIGLGVLASALAWLPGLLEAGLVHLKEAREGYFLWSVHLVAPWQVVWSRWGFGLSQAGTDDGMSFRLGPLLLLLAAAAGACAVDASRRSRVSTETDRSRLGLTALLLLGVIAGALLMTPWGAFAWRALPLLPSVQFPWRIAGPVTLLLCLLAALACDGVRERMAAFPARLPAHPARLPAHPARLLPAALVALTIVLGYPFARPGDRSHPDPLAWTPDEIARRGSLATSLEELEPLTVVERAPWSPILASVVEGAAVVSTERLTPEHWRLSLRGGPATIVLRLHDFPGWTVEGDGVTKLEPEPVTGRVRIAVLPGSPDRDRVAELRLRRTRVEWLGLLASAAGAIGIAALARKWGHPRNGDIRHFQSEMTKVPAR